MTIRIEERLVVQAPASAVWAYLVDPRRVVTCLPGAQLIEVVDDRTFRGTVKVKVGALTITYRGSVRMEEVDAAGRRVCLVGEGSEATGTGQARMFMESRLADAAGGGTEVMVRADLDVVGRIVQLGRGMIEQLSHQIFEQFSSCVRATLGAEAGAGSVAAGAAPPREEALRALPLLLRALWAWFRGLFRRRPPRRSA